MNITPDTVFVFVLGVVLYSALFQPRIIIRPWSKIPPRVRSQLVSNSVRLSSILLLVIHRGIHCAIGQSPENVFTSALLWLTCGSFLHCSLLAEQRKSIVLSYILWLPAIAYNPLFSIQPIVLGPGSLIDLSYSSWFVIDLVAAAALLISLRWQPQAKTEPPSEPDYIETPLTWQEGDEIADLEEELKRPLTQDELAKVLGPGRLQNPKDEP